MKDYLKDFQIFSNNLSKIQLLQLVMHALVNMVCAYAWAWSWSSLSSSSLIIQSSSRASSVSSSRLIPNVTSMSSPSSRCMWVGMYVGRYPCIVKWALLRKVLHTQRKASTGPQGTCMETITMKHLYIFIF